MRSQDHWSATAHLWSSGEPVLTWHVVFAGHAALAAVAARLAPVLERPFLTPVPVPWLHATVQNVGPASAVTNGTRSRLVAEVAARCADVAPIEATIGPAFLVDQGVAANVQPHERLVALRELLQDADAAVRGPDAAPGRGQQLWPHLGYAYACTGASTDELKDDLDALAAETTAALTIEAVSLLRLRREPRLYRWEPVTRVPLGGRAATPSE